MRHFTEQLSDDAVSGDDISLSSCRLLINITEGEGVDISVPFAIVDCRLKLLTAIKAIAMAR